MLLDIPIDIVYTYIECANSITNDKYNYTHINL